MRGFVLIHCHNVALLCFQETIVMVFANKVDGQKINLPAQQKAQSVADMSRFAIQQEHLTVRALQERLSAVVEHVTQLNMVASLHLDQGHARAQVGVDQIIYATGIRHPIRI